MKTKHFITIVTAAALLVLAACKPTEDPIAHLTDGVTVTTADPTFISGSTASCGAEVTANDAGLLIELGVCWSKSEKPTVDDNTMKTHKCSRPYTCLLTNLEPNTQYHVRGYAKYGTEYCYGDEKTFTTLGPDAPAASPVTTHEAYEIYYSYFRASATLEPFGANNYYVGICWSTQPDFTIEDCVGYEIGYYDDEHNAYQVICDELMPNTTYYYRAFVAFRQGDYYYYDYFYGNILSLTTPEIPFLLDLYTDYMDYSPYSEYIHAYGNGFCTMPNLINQVGFCYSTTNEYPTYESDLLSIAATPTGEYFSFDKYIYNISANQKYYIRSFARYKTDSIKYGNVVSVDTY